MADSLSFIVLLQWGPLRIYTWQKSYLNIIYGVCTVLCCVWFVSFLSTTTTSRVYFLGLLRVEWLV